MNSIGGEKNRRDLILKTFAACARDIKTNGYNDALGEMGNVDGLKEWSIGEMLSTLPPDVVKVLFSEVVKNMEHIESMSSQLLYDNQNKLNGLTMWVSKNNSQPVSQPTPTAKSGPSLKNENQLNGKIVGGILKQKLADKPSPEILSNHPVMWNVPNVANTTHLSCTVNSVPNQALEGLPRQQALERLSYLINQIQLPIQMGARVGEERCIERMQMVQMVNVSDHCVDQTVELDGRGRIVDPKRSPRPRALASEVVRIFSCHECHKSYGRKSHLRRHILTVHGGVSLGMAQRSGAFEPTYPSIITQFGLTTSDTGEQGSSGETVKPITVASTPIHIISLATSIANIAQKPLIAVEAAPKHDTMKMTGQRVSYSANSQSSADNKDPVKTD